MNQKQIEHTSTRSEEFSESTIELIREYSVMGMCILLLVLLIYSGSRLLKSQRAKFTFDASILFVQALVSTALIVYEVMYTHLLILLSI